MEIDFTALKNAKGWVFAGATILVLVGLAVFGKFFTPDGNGVLSWREWKIRKLQRAYQQEHAQLVQDAVVLADMLNQPTDPARVQVQLDAMRSRWRQGGVATLENDRVALGQAAQAVQEWSIGIVERDVAILAVQNAMSELEK